MADDGGRLQKIGGGSEVEEDRKRWQGWRNIGEDGGGCRTMKKNEGRAGGSMGKVEEDVGRWRKIEGKWRKMKEDG
jgi:hypothetical protein